MVGAADDVGETHVQVVSDDTEVIGRDAVRAKEDEVLNFGVGELDFAEDCIVKGGRAAVRD